MNTSAAAPLALCVSGLARRFGAQVALHPLDFELARGRTLAVLGPNGAGKSTLLRVLAGLMRPSAGAFFVGANAGSARVASRLRARAIVGFAGHENFSYAALSARENLELAARLHRQPSPRAAAARALRELGLEGVAERRTAQLSHGLARRLGIARAMLHAPQLLLLDEPFSGLDPRAAARLKAHLKNFCNAAATPAQKTPHESAAPAATATRAQQQTSHEDNAPAATTTPAPSQTPHERAAPAATAAPAQQTSHEADAPGAAATPAPSQTSRATDAAGAARSPAPACVLVTHDPARVVELAQHALVLVRGRARALPSEAFADASALARAYHATVAALEGAA